MGDRILHVMDAAAPEAGSVAVALRTLAAGLNRRGLRVEILARTGEAALDETPGPVRRPASEMETALRACDLVHIHGWGNDTTLRAATSARGGGIPYVISPYGALTPSRHRPIGLSEKLRGMFGRSALIRAAALIGAVNAFEAESLRRYGLRCAIDGLPTGLDFDEYVGHDHPPDAPRDVRVLLVLGALEAIGGGLPLLKAFAACGTVADGWHIVFAGAEVGDWRKQMEAAVRRKGARERVRFVCSPNVPTQRAWLARADALAYVALHPTCPTPVVQGLAAGVPVLATTMVAPDSLGDAIITCAPARESIARGLRSLLSMTDDARRSLGCRAREAAKLFYDIDAVTARHAEVYARALGRVAPSAAARPLSA